jgi:hypothetical protein
MTVVIEARACSFHLHQSTHEVMAEEKPLSFIASGGSRREEPLQITAAIDPL